MKAYLPARNGDTGPEAQSRCVKQGAQAGGSLLHTQLLLHGREQDLWGEGWGGAVLDTVSTGGSRQALLPKTLILGVQDPWLASQGPRAGSERGPEGPTPGESQPCLTSVVSVSLTALFPLMAATLCSSCRPRSSLPVTRSHRADSASHLGQGMEEGEWEAGHTAVALRAWLQWVAQGLA